MSKLSTFLIYGGGFLFLIAGIIHTQQYLDKQTNKNKETIYFVPKKSQLNYTTFGYKPVIADMMWLKSVSYFLTHLGGDNDYKYLGGMYRTCIALDPTFKQVYKDAMNFLMNDPENYHEGETILLKGVENMPNDWEISYMTGFSYSYYLKDPQKAIIYLAKAQELIPKDSKHAGYLDSINILIRSNSEKKLDNYGLVKYWIERLKQNKSKVLKEFIKKNIIKYLNKTMADSLNKKLNVEAFQVERKKFFVFCQENKIDHYLKLNWKNIFIKEDANGYQWIYSNHKKKFYSYGNARENIERKLILFNLKLWILLEKYYTISFKELRLKPYEKQASFIKLKPDFKSFPTLDEIIKMGFKIKLETPLYPFYDQAKGFFRLPELNELKSIPDLYK
ncbi:MAG: hypothetical protein COA79_21400 [Planctomycetota bacterium]|nr:MAG: hypothetical protein COA79_21400 [Planctomycetota bacterium]